VAPATGFLLSLSIGSGPSFAGRRLCRSGHPKKTAQKSEENTCLFLGSRYYLFLPEHGALAQLVERLNGIEKVSGSNPLCSTKPKEWFGGVPKKRLQTKARHLFL
jgi:hypothetical protein